jgi:hypothetical protein
MMIAPNKKRLIVNGRQRMRKKEDRYIEDLQEQERHTLFNTTYTELKMKTSCSSLKYVLYIASHVFRDQDEMKFLTCPYMNRLTNYHRLLKVE